MQAQCGISGPTGTPSASARRRTICAVAAAGRIHVVERAEVQIGDVVVEDDDGSRAIGSGPEDVTEARRVAGIQRDHDIPRAVGWCGCDLAGARQELQCRRYGVGTREDRCRRLGQGLEQPAERQQRADGIAVRVDVAHCQHAPRMAQAACNSIRVAVWRRWPRLTVHRGRLTIAVGLTAAVRFRSAGFAGVSIMFLVNRRRGRARDGFQQLHRCVERDARS